MPGILRTGWSLTIETDSRKKDLAASWFWRRRGRKGGPGDKNLMLWEEWKRSYPPSPAAAARVNLRVVSGYPMGHECQPQAPQILGPTPGGTLEWVSHLKHLQHEKWKDEREVLFVSDSASNTWTTTFWAPLSMVFQLMLGLDCSCLPCFYPKICSGKAYSKDSVGDTSWTPGLWDCSDLSCDRHPEVSSCLLEQWMHCPVVQPAGEKQPPMNTQ